VKQADDDRDVVRLHLGQDRRDVQRVDEVRLAGPPDLWGIAGDQLYVDIDLSATNLPAGSQLRIGEAILEISATPHTGCAKFSGRFGTDALKFVSTPVGRELRLRGVNTRIVRGGTIRVGDTIGKHQP